MTNDNADRESYFSGDVLVAVLGLGTLGIAVIGSIATFSYWPVVVWFVTIIAGVVLVFTRDLVPRRTVGDAQHAYLESENKRLRQQLGEDPPTDNEGR